MPLSFWCGTSSRGSPQQSMVQEMATCTPVMLQEASTNNDTWGANPFPAGSQHLPSVASPTCWSALEYASSHCYLVQPPALGFSHRNCPMLRILGAGGQVIDSETVAIHLHMAIRCRASTNAASSLPSVRGCRSDHQAKSSSVYCSSQHCNHLVVFQTRSTTSPSACKSFKDPCVGVPRFSFGAYSCTL